jgi:hypothetical protein
MAKNKFDFPQPTKGNHETRLSKKSSRPNFYTLYSLPHTSPPSIQIFQKTLCNKHPNKNALSPRTQIPDTPPKPSQNQRASTTSKRKAIKIKIIVKTKWTDAFSHKMRLWEPSTHALEIRSVVYDENRAACWERNALMEGTCKTFVDHTRNY